MTLARDVLGQPLPGERQQLYRGTKWIHPRRDLQASIRLLMRNETSVREIVDSWRAPVVFALLSRRDPLPFAADFAHAGWNFLEHSVLGTVRRAAEAWRARPGPAHATQFLLPRTARVMTAGAPPSDPAGLP
jgi:hypothetical protein